MSRQKTVTAEYLASMSGLTLEEQAVLFALIAQSDDEGRGLAHPEVIRQNNPQLASNMSACDIAAVQESFLEGRWNPYVEYHVGGIAYYALADYKQFCTRNHPTPSKLPAPPAELLPVLPQPVPSRGRPPKDESAKGAAKSRAKRKAAPAPKEKWTAPKHPESTYQEFRSIFNEVLGSHVREMFSGRFVEICIPTGLLPPTTIDHRQKVLPAPLPKVPAYPLWQILSGASPRGTPNEGSVKFICHALISLSNITAAVGAYSSSFSCSIFPGTGMSGNPVNESMQLWLR